MRNVETLFLQEKLLQDKIISIQQLQELYAWRKETKSSFVKALLDLKVVDEEKLAALIAKMYKWPVINLDDYQIDKSVASALPKEISSKYNLLVIERLGSVNCVVLSQPLEEPERHKVEEMLKSKIQFFIDVYSKIEAAINHIYSAEDK